MRAAWVLGLVLAVAAPARADKLVTAAVVFAYPEGEAGEILNDTYGLELAGAVELVRGFALVATFDRISAVHPRFHDHVVYRALQAGVRATFGRSGWHLVLEATIGVHELETSAGGARLAIGGTYTINDHVFASVLVGRTKTGGVGIIEEVEDIRLTMTTIAIGVGTQF